jgi:hypothetical protein
MNKPAFCSICCARFQDGDEFAIGPISLFNYSGVRINLENVALCEECYDHYGHGYKALNGGYGEKWDWATERRII